MEQQASHAVAGFGAKLFKEADSWSSTVCSPLSAEMVMAMLALSCKDKANKELLDALEIPDDDALRTSFAYLTSTLKSIRGATVNVANKIFVKTGADLKPSTMKDAEEVFGSSVEQIDFRGREAAAKAINDWLAPETDSASLGVTLDENTGLVLVNAVSFKSMWEKPFDTRLNAECLFHSPYNTTTEVTMMKTTETLFKYGVSQELNARLNFEGGEASMVIVLPQEVYGLQTVLQNLAAGFNIMAYIDTLRNTKLDVMLPIFEGGRTLQLNFTTLLIKLGIKSIFDERKSEVDMLTANDDLLGANAGQYTIIKVDERESTKTAHSIVSTKDVCTDCVERFVADRPFLYLVIVRGIPIFMGTYKGGRQDILNYSCDHLNHSFSLSVCTFYSRYDNKEEQIRLSQILDRYTRRVIWDANSDNVSNTIIEHRHNNSSARTYFNPIRYSH